MKILGFLGSPRVNGKCSRLLQKALEGAASMGAEFKRYDLINCNIQYCRGCGNCYEKNPELTIGECPLNDDMASILEEYLSADGYIFATPTYELNITALMKTFLEREIAFTYKEDALAAPGARPGIGANFLKKACFIVTANAPEEYEEIMGNPCYEAFETILMLEEIDTMGKLFVGAVAAITEETFSEKLELAYQLGIDFVKAIKTAQASD